MGTNNLTDYSSTPLAQSSADRFDQYRNALLQDIVPRNSGGLPAADAGKCGTNTLPFSEGNFTAININGTPFDPNNLLTDLNQVRSGAVRSGSEQPLFLQAAGSSNALDILATTTNLLLTINGDAVTFATDVTLSSLTVAPSTNNTALVNNTDFADQNFTKYVVSIDYDTAGSEITALDNQFAAFSLNGEYFIARVNNTDSKLEVYQRGFFFDDTDTPIARQVITDNDTITLLKLAYIYADSTGTSADVGYTTPIYSSAEPSSPTTGDYWYNVTLQQWQRYDGSVYQNVNRMLIGYAILDSSNCLATRCIDFAKAYQDTNTFTLEKASDSTLKTVTDFESYISVYGNNFYYNGRLTWDMATDLESGVTEVVDTTYYFYITETGAVKISDERPIYKQGLNGIYHPFYTWRWVATCDNDSSGNLEEVTKDYIGGLELIEASASGTAVSYWLKPEGVKQIKVTLTGTGENTSGLLRDSIFLGMTAEGGKSGGATAAATGGDINLNAINNGNPTYWGVGYGYGETGEGAATAIKYYDATNIDYAKVTVGGTSTDPFSGVCLIEYIG